MLKTNRTALLVTLLVCATGVSALTFYVAMKPKAVDPDAKPRVESPQPEINNPAPKPIVAAQPTKLTLFLPHMGTKGLAFENRLVEIPSDSDVRVTLINQFLKESKIASPDARLLGIQVIDGVAHLGFSREFDRTFGTFEEKSLLDGFSANLGQFPEIQSYVLEIDAKQMETLGSVDLKDPVPVIRPAQVPSETPSSEPPQPTDQPNTTAQKSESAGSVSMPKSP